MATVFGDVTVKGDAEVAAAFDRAQDRIRSAMARAIYERMNEIRLDSMSRTPVDTGALRASHYVSEPEVSKGEVSCRIGVGGPATPYAVVQHEDLSLHHEVGEAKFLENAINASVSTFQEDIANRTREIVQRGGAGAAGGEGGGAPGSGGRRTKGGRGRARKSGLRKLVKIVIGILRRA